MKNFASILAVLLVLIGSASSVSAQQTGVCGTHNMHLLKPALFRNKEVVRTQVLPRNNIKYIPVKFHLIADDSGNGRVTEDKVFDMLCELNKFYLPLNMQFYIKDGFNYFNHSTTYNNPRSTSAGVKMHGQRDAKAINVYLTNKADYEDNGNQQTLGYFDPESDWLVIIKGQVSAANASTIEHELGHFFTLNHTFNGWDCEAYDKSVHGQQVGKYAPCSFGGSIENENMDGSNCEYGGDYICDTKPDYNFGLGWTGGCNFTDVVYDFKGAKVDPDEKNVMGYFLNCNEYYFSTEQGNIVFADYATSANRQYIRTNYVPPVLTITEAPLQASPVNNETVSSFDNVNLIWTPVAGADRYVVVINRVVGNVVLTPAQVYYTTATNLLLTNLEKSKIYQWKVLPYNEIAACPNPSLNFRFTTGATSNTHDINPDQVFNVVPNPVKAGSEITVSFQAGKTFNADFYIFNMAGQSVQSFRSVSVLGTQPEVRLPLLQLPAGMYTLNVVSDIGVSSRTFVVQP